MDAMDRIQRIVDMHNIKLQAREGVGHWFNMMVDKKQRLEEKKCKERERKRRSKQNKKIAEQREKQMNDLAASFHPSLSKGPVTMPLTATSVHFSFQAINILFY